MRSDILSAEEHAHDDPQPSFQWMVHYAAIGSISRHSSELEPLFQK
ncbi:hypothetical protein [Bradyrhizobium sp.]|nr:hypothetical protein [Bradyrhizobium sp.]HMM87966.1 hypothetical protein [Bradyrhizobium sp.]